MPEQYPDQYRYPRQNDGRDMRRSGDKWRNTVKADEFFKQHSDEMTDRHALKRIFETLEMAEEYREEGKTMEYLKCLDKAYNMIKSLYAIVERYK